MFGSIGMPELMMIMLIVLVLFGPKKIPELARGLGKGLAELRRAADDVKQELNFDDIDKPKIEYKKPTQTYEHKSPPEGD